MGDRWRALVLLVAGLAGCEAGSGRVTSGWVVRDSAGVTIVENDHTRPAWGEGEGWRLSPEPSARLGSFEGDPETQLFRVIDAHRLADGRIAIANSGSSEVKLFGPDGSYAGTIGGPGEGPGEFRAPWVVHELEPDSILVIDLYAEIAIFDARGEYRREFFPERSSAAGQDGGEGFEPVDQFGDGTLLWRRHVRDEPPESGVYRNRIHMVRTLLDGSFGGSLGEFDDQTLFSSPSGTQYLFGAWAKEAAADSTMWYGPGDRFELREIALDGRLKRLVRLDRPLRPVTEADVGRERELVKASFGQQGREQIFERLYAEARYPEHFPAHFELLTDRSGHFWVQDYQSWNWEVERVWSVFDREGRFLGDVVVPAGHDVLEIGDDWVLTRWTDDFDVEYVFVFDLEKG